MIGQTVRRRSVDFQSQANVKIVGPTSCMALWYHISELQCPIYFLQNLNNILTIRIQLKASLQNYQRLTDPPAWCMNPFNTGILLCLGLKEGHPEHKWVFIVILCDVPEYVAVAQQENIPPFCAPGHNRHHFILFYLRFILISRPPCRKYTMHLQIPTNRSCFCFEIYLKRFYWCYRDLYLFWWLRSFSGGGTLDSTPPISAISCVWGNQSFIFTFTF